MTKTREPRFILKNKEELSVRSEQFKSYHEALRYLEMYGLTGYIIEQI